MRTLFTLLLLLAIPDIANAGPAGAIVLKFGAWLFTAQTIGATIARIAFSALLATVSSKLFGPKVPGIGLSSRDVTVRGSLEHRKVVYGEARVSGPVAYINSSNTNNSDLWYVIPMCHGESEDLVSVWIDKFEIPKADITWTAGTGGADGTGSGGVTTARWLGTGSPAARSVFVRYYLGEDAQPVCGVLDTSFSDITTTFRLRGITYVVFELRYNAATEKVWEDVGQPSNLMAVLKGRKIYDPRLDSTNGGSGSHRYTDSTTWAWSDNPALCVADYLMTYMGVDPATSINWTSVSDAADDCDALVVIPPAASPENKQARFTCNGALSLGDSHRDNLEKILSSMDGRLSYSAGQWYVRASVWEASSVSITEDDLAGPVQVRGSAPRSERFNLVRGFYVDPDRDYEPVEFQHVTDATYVTRDNGKTLPYDLQLAFTNNEFMAQRIAYRLLEQGDNQIIVDLTLKLGGANVKVGDVIDLTVDEFSWSAKTFRVVGWGRDNNGNFKITAREDSSARYTDPAVGDYTTKTNGAITLPSLSTPAPSGLSATSIATGIRLDWTNPAAKSFEWIDVYESATSAWSGASRIARVRTDHLDVIYTTGTTRYFWVRAVSFGGVESLRNPDSDTSSVTATAGVIAIDTPIVTEVADSDSSALSPQLYPSATQPALEDSALSGFATFTSPANIDTRCFVSWTGQAQISNTTSGTAVGIAYLDVLIQVNGGTVYNKKISLEGYTTSTNQWATLSGGVDVDVPAGQDIDVYLRSYRTFSTSGASPAQTHYWQNCIITIRPTRDAIT